MVHHERRVVKTYIDTRAQRSIKLALNLIVSFPLTPKLNCFIHACTVQGVCMGCGYLATSYMVSFIYCIHCATEDQLRNYCLTCFEDLEDRIGCQQTRSTYVRWGRTVCANDTGAVLVYSGRVAGSSYAEDGGGADMLCLPDDPQYLNCTADTVQGHSPLIGAEFHTWVARPDLGLQNCPCAVCYVPRPPA